MLQLLDDAAFRNNLGVPVQLGPWPSEPEEAMLVLFSLTQPLEVDGLAHVPSVLCRAVGDPIGHVGVDFFAGDEGRPDYLNEVRLGVLLQVQDEEPTLDLRPNIPGAVSAIEYPGGHV